MIDALAWVYLSGVIACAAVWGGITLANLIGHLDNVSMAMQADERWPTLKDSHVAKAEKSREDVIRCLRWVVAVVFWPLVPFYGAWWIVTTAWRTGHGYEQWRVKQKRLK